MIPISVREISQNMKYRDRSKNYPEIHSEIAVFELTLAANL